MTPPPARKPANPAASGSADTRDQRASSDRGLPAGQSSGPAETPFEDVQPTLADIAKWSQWIKSTKAGGWIAYAIFTCIGCAAGGGAWFALAENRISNLEIALNSVGDREQRLAKAADSLKTVTRAVLSFAAGSYDTAFEQYRQAYEQDEDPLYLCAMGVCRDSAGRPNEAISEYRRCLKALARSPNPQLMLSVCRNAILATQAISPRADSQIDEWATQALDAVKAVPDPALARQRAELLYFRGLARFFLTKTTGSVPRYSQAKEDLASARETDGHHKPWASYMISCLWCLKQEGDWERNAETALRSAWADAGIERSLLLAMIADVPAEDESAIDSEIRGALSPFRATGKLAPLLQDFNEALKKR